MKASQIMSDVGVLLMDEEFVRWPLSELANWIDLAVKTIITAKPSAKSKSLTLTLTEGTKQSLPADQGIIQLLDIIRNVNPDGSAGRMIRVTARSELDSNEPNWHNKTRVPFRREVRQYVFDEILPRTFWTYPGNDGTGKVESLVSFLPNTVKSQHSGDATDISTWDIEVGLDDQYQPAVLDYVLFRCLSKESPEASIAKAGNFLNAFTNTIGVQTQVEGATTPTRRPS